MVSVAGLAHRFFATEDTEFTEGTEGRVRAANGSSLRDSTLRAGDSQNRPCGSR